VKEVVSKASTWWWPTVDNMESTKTIARRGAWAALVSGTIHVLGNPRLWGIPNLMSVRRSPHIPFGAFHRAWIGHVSVIANRSYPNARTAVDSIRTEHCDRSAPDTHPAVVIHLVFREFSQRNFRVSSPCRTERPEVYWFTLIARLRDAEPTGVKRVT